ncbi:MAG: DUF3883 domain-containing protein [Bacilli bacterium]|nr:DUF3883 domain-containing protein [Bacilli bacterium]
MEEKVYEYIGDLYFESTYSEIINTLKYILEYFKIENDVYKKRRIVKSFGEKLGRYAVNEEIDHAYRKDYHIFNPNKSPIAYTSYYFSGLRDIRDFKKMAKELLKIYEGELVESNNSHITEEEIRDAIALVLERVPYFKEENLFENIYTFIHAKQNIVFNSYVLPEINTKINRYFLNCFQMQNENIFPRTVFFHELGHIMACEITKSTVDIPYSFYALVKEFININYVDSKETMLEIFCDFFATALLINTKFEKYAPYKLDKNEKKTLLRYFYTIKYHFDYYDAYLDLNRYYDKLFESVKKKGLFSIKDFTKDELKQLTVVEHAGKGMLTNIFKESTSQITSRRQAKVGSVKYDFCSLERLIKLFIVSCQEINSVELLKLMQNMRMKEVYEINYQNKEKYKLCFNIEEEIKKQEEILKYNKEHDDNPQTTLDDILLELAYCMYKRGELSLKYFDVDFTPNREYILKVNIDNFDKLEKKKKTSDTIITKLENFTNHETKVNNKKKKSAKKDYLKQYVNQQESGATGEEFAHKQEILRLKNYPELVEKIIPYFKTDPNKGYDILSFNEDGSEKYIEVKSSATNNSDKKIHFFISDNEDEFIRNNTNSCIYYVYNFKNKKIKEISREQYLKMTKKPRVFEINVDCE